MQWHNYAFHDTVTKWSLTNRGRHLCRPQTPEALSRCCQLRTPHHPLSHSRRHQKVERGFRPKYSASYRVHPWCLHNTRLTESTDDSHSQATHTFREYKPEIADEKCCSTMRKASRVGGNSNVVVTTKTMRQIRMPSKTWGIHQSGWMTNLHCQKKAYYWLD